MAKKIFVSIFGMILIIGIFNIPVSTKQGINYKVRVYKIPLYIKIIEFIDRDYRYRALSRDITRDKKNDRDKALAILEWVHSNIRTDMPKGWPIYDDHIMGIIIRGYGESDQVNDVFTTLCMYAGLPAGWEKIDMPGRGVIILSFVEIDGKWCIFDAYRNTALKYEDYFPYISQCKESVTSRCKKQMPFHRIIYEISKILHKDKELTK